MGTLKRSAPVAFDDSWITCWGTQPVGNLRTRAGTGLTAAGRSPAAAVTLDLEACNSPVVDTKYVVRPQFCGGMLDPEGGTGKRLEAFKKFEALAMTMTKGGMLMLTLTIDRTKHPDPERAHRSACKLLSKLLSERLGIAVWARVLEIQTKTGSGFPHWHILLDLRGTRWWNASRNWADLKGFNNRCWEVWRDEMGMGGVNVQLIRSQQGAAGYVVKYITKPCAQWPPWILDRQRAPRIMGFSRAAAAIIRRALHLKVRVPSGRGIGKRTHRTTVHHRLAASGLRCKVLQENTHADGTLTWRLAGRLPGRLDWYILHQADLPGLRFAAEESAGRSRLIVHLESGGRSVELAVNELARLAVGLGFVDRARDEYRKRLHDLAEGWDWMQSERSGG